MTNVMAERTLFAVVRESAPLKLVPSVRNRHLGEADVASPNAKR